MPSFFFHELFSDPFVFVVPVGWDFFHGLAHCRERAGGRPFHVVMPTQWDVTATRQEYARIWNKTRHICPEATMLWLVPRRSDAELLAGIGINVMHCHKNAFLDETIFRPDRNATKQYNAAFSANSAAFKRHELAWGVKRLALVTYIFPGAESLDLVKGYRDLAYSNFDRETNTMNSLSAKGVASVLTQAHCGLMLSQEEGGNYASAEYMLCGLPLITTASTGGRHELWDSRQVRVVAPTPAAVEAGVAQCLDWPVDPEELHALALAKAIPHRRRLLDWLSQVIERDAHALANANAWLPSFRDKLRAYFQTGTA
jgi:glycosyltransferase involved in cell wall biosynthesis